MKKITSVFVLMAFLVGALSFAQNVQVYSEEEYSKLKKEEVAKYWADLENAIKSYEEKKSETDAKINVKEKSIANLKSEISDYDGQINNYAAKKSDLEATIEKSTGVPYNVFITLPSKYLIDRNDNLVDISKKDQVYNDQAKWPRLWRDNKDVLNSPQIITPGQEIKILRGKPKFHTVLKGECLWKISGYWEIYNDATQWPKIFEANKDKIKDPDLIYPKQILSIPREW